MSEYEGYKTNNTRVRDVFRRQSLWWARAGVQNAGAMQHLLRRSEPRLLGDFVKSLEHVSAVRRADIFGEAPSQVLCRGIQKHLCSPNASPKIPLILLDMVRREIPPATESEVIAAVEAMLLLLKALLGKAIEGE
jgi:hypothetical protein